MIKKILKEINKVPFPVAIPNHDALESRMDGVTLPEEKMLKEGWDTLRSMHPRYSFSGDRETWLKEIYQKKDGQDKEIDQRAEDIVTLCRTNGHKTLFSIGVGAAGLEYRIAKLAPEIRVIATEYPPDTVHKLKGVFLEGEVRQFDAFSTDAWKEVDPNALVLIYRMDREFTPVEWRKIFQFMSGAGVRHGLFVLQYTFTLLWYVQERIRTYRALLKGWKVSMAGYIHNVPSLRNLWKREYSDVPVRIGSWQGFYLSKNP